MYIIKKIGFFIFLCVVILLYTGFTYQNASIHGYDDDSAFDLYLLASFHEEAAAPSWAETVMRAFAAAYPGRIGPVEYRNGDWAFFLDGRWFYYAQGRILPAERRGHIEEYRPLIHLTGNYLAELPSWESTAANREVFARQMEETRRQPQTGPQPPRAQYFHKTLWNIRNQNEAWARQVRIDFLGHRLTIHSGISHKVKRIEEIILAEAKTNPAVCQWVSSLGTVTGWGWRNVAGSGHRSTHSYGIAIDILPRNLGGLATYWLWSARYNPEWWNIPFSRRYHPPNEVISAFESFGFIWGGKWLNHFDTMHFEFRPEAFILSNIPMTNFCYNCP